MKLNFLKTALTALIFLASSLVSIANAILINEIEPNDTLVTAQNVDAFFSLTSEVNIEDSNGVNTSTTIPHVEIQGILSRTPSYDYFSFWGTANSTAIFDIDCGETTDGQNCASYGDFDSWLSLFNPSGTLLTYDDDTFSQIDTGSSSSSSWSLDSYIQLTLPTTGQYAIRVGSFPSETPVQAQSDYILNISVENHSTVPEPSVIALMGLGLLGFVATRRKHKQ